ncbi:MAG UNVERIFIED_CONTAM: hypothetical protein LVT10_13215 [Anaerolineae bacterium]
MSPSTSPNLTWRDLQPADRPHLIEHARRIRCARREAHAPLPRGFRLGTTRLGGFNPTGATGCLCVG